MRQRASRVDCCSTGRPAAHRCVRSVTAQSRPRALRVNKAGGADLIVVETRWVHGAGRGVEEGHVIAFMLLLLQGVLLKVGNKLYEKLLLLWLDTPEDEAAILKAKDVACCQV